MRLHRSFASCAKPVMQNLPPKKTTRKLLPISFFLREQLSTVLFYTQLNIFAYAVLKLV